MFDFDWSRKGLNPHLKTPEYCYKCDAVLQDTGWMGTPDGYIICLKCGGYLEPEEDYPDD